MPGVFMAFTSSLLNLIGQCELQCSSEEGPSGGEESFTSVIYHYVPGSGLALPTCYSMQPSQHLFRVNLIVCLSGGNGRSQIKWSFNTFTQLVSGKVRIGITTAQPLIPCFACCCALKSRIPGENLALGRRQGSDVMLCAAGLPAQLSGIEDSCSHPWVHK